MGVLERYDGEGFYIVIVRRDFVVLGRRPDGAVNLVVHEDDLELA